MVKTSSNLVVGAPATIIVSAYGVAEGSGVDIGATEGGAKLTYTPEFFFKKADQWTGKVGAVKTDEDLILEFNCAEETLANLAYAYGYPTSAVVGNSFFAGGNATVTERTIYVNGNAPGGGLMKMTLHKCVIIGATELNMVKNDKTMLKITVQVLQDTSKPTNQQYYELAFSGIDTTPPTVAMTSPVEDGSVSAGTTNAITLTFTEATNAIDESTLVYGNADGATIFVNDIEDPTATALVAGSISYNAGTKVLTFTPTSNWATAGNNYQIIITTGVRDTAGNHLANTFFGHFVSA